MMDDESTSLSAPRLDRWFWLVVVLAAVVVVPRSSIHHTRSIVLRCADDQFHLRRGLHYLTGKPADLVLTPFDGPLGQAMDALPMVLGGNTMAEAIHAENMPGHGLHLTAKANAAQQFAMAARRDVLFGHAISPDALLMRIAIFKAFLFIPLVGLIFYWSRWLYGLHAGFVAISLLLIDPTLAAHIPVAAIDVLGVEMIMFACFALWIWARHPSKPKLVVAAAVSSCRDADQTDSGSHAGRCNRICRSLLVKAAAERNILRADSQGIRPNTRIVSINGCSNLAGNEM